MIVETIKFEFTDAVRRQLEGRGMSEEDIRKQLLWFQQGMPPIKLQRACTEGDGIRKIAPEDHTSLLTEQVQAADKGRFLKFVPASGAATRMFKPLSAMAARFESLFPHDLEANARRGDSDAKFMLQFINNVTRFAFYPEFAEVVAKNGHNISVVKSNGDLKLLLELLLTPRGLNLSSQPKALIPFHAYSDHIRTPIEEHLVEALAYASDVDGNARIHFTVQDERLEPFHREIELRRRSLENDNCRLQVEYSRQRASTETIALDLDSNPAVDAQGRLTFRPAGHGALLKNLAGLAADLVYIKNIDNVAMERLLPATVYHKRLLGGLLVKLQSQQHRILTRLESDRQDSEAIREGESLIRDKFQFELPSEWNNWHPMIKGEFIYQRLNRPLRVCGMVPNRDEPGGGPFWILGKDKIISPQIVEMTQIDHSDSAQEAIVQTATHFNPVDLVCGVRDHHGHSYDLDRYCDWTTGQITEKSWQGRPVKAMERPGLWNGSMAFWNTVFVEVPISTFNPVKTVNDLLRPEHQL
ncbi:MAG: DUF4301 family protein [Calditrichota bacterium]